jgi:hypothetical protein
MFESKVSLDSLSLASIPLRMVAGPENATMATGTGFLFDFKGYLYLITNAHNITRVNPATKERTTCYIAFPEKIVYFIRRIISDDPFKMVAFELEAPLYSDSEMLCPLWYEHPKFGYDVDVVALPLFSKIEIPADVRIFPINSFDLEDRFPLEASDDVFILGYPYSIDGDKKLPIWKRGSIATEPAIDIDGLPKLLIDTASRPGMSGSPVIFQRTGIHGFNLDKLSGEEIIGRIRGFVGVYSGRIVARDPLDAQLGVVWKSTVISEILESKTIGGIEFQSV